MGGEVAEALREVLPRNGGRLGTLPIPFVLSAKADFIRQAGDRAVRRFVRPHFGRSACRCNNAVIAYG